MSNKLLMANQKEKKTNLRHQIAIIRQIILIFFLLSLYLGINPTSVTAMNSGGTNEGYIQGQIDEVRIGNVPDSGDGITTNIKAEIPDAGTLIDRWVMNDGLEIIKNEPSGLATENGTLNLYDLSTNASTASPFTIIALPDTQHYTDYPDRDVIFNSQTTWAVTNQSVRNIVFLTHLGDLTENGEMNFDDSEWIIADAAMGILERTADPNDDLPYGVTPGNHDIDGGTTKFEEWFGVARFSGRSYYGGNYGSNNLNSYGLFSASGLNFIIIHIDSSDITPSTAVLDWADGLLKADLTRRGIVVTHQPLASAGNPANFSNAGQAIYDALKDNPNFFLMLGGHVSGEGRRQDTFDGHTVYTLLSDYQGRPNGGNGWLRIMEFQPANNQIQVYTYSPYLGEFETDDNSQFTLSYDMTGTTPPTPPATPTLNDISNSDLDGDYTVSWSSASGAEGYELQEQFNSGGWSTIYTGLSTSVDMSGKADGSWCYQVRASNGGGSSGWSTSKCTTVETLPTPPATPTLNDISNSDLDGDYTVSWSSASGAEGYELQEQFNSGGWSTIYTGLSTSVDMSGKAGGSWCYQVRASNGGGSSGWSSAKCATVATPPAPPAVPTLNDISNSDMDGDYTVRWSGVSGATGYELQERFNSGSWSMLYTGSSTSWDLSGKADGSWCYQVQASNAGGSSDWSSSKCATVTTPPVTTEPPPQTTEPPPTEPPPVTTEPPPQTTEPPATTEPPPATTEPSPQVTPSPTSIPVFNHNLFIPIILVH